MKSGGSHSGNRRFFLLFHVSTLHRAYRMLRIKLQKSPGILRCLRLPLLSAIGKDLFHFFRRLRLTVSAVLIDGLDRLFCELIQMRVCFTYLSIFYQSLH